MKKSVKILALVCAMVLVLFTFAGCETNSTTDVSSVAKGNSSAVKETASLSSGTLITNGTLTIGTNAEFAPFEYYEGDQIVGIDADIVKAIGEKLNLKVNIIHMDFDTLPNALSSGTIDCIAAGFTENATREESMDFTTSYYNASQSIIVLNDSKVATKEDLAGLTVGAQSGTTGETEATAIVGATNVKSYSNGMYAVQDLVNGNVKAVVIDNAPAISLIEKFSGTKLIEGQFDEENYAIAVKKGNTELQNALNDALSQMINDGTIKDIVAKYIG